jgi:hypothetical protein
MEIDAIKVAIEKQYKLWKIVPGDIEDFTTAEIYENAVRSMIIDYCEGEGYEVEGFPFQKRILGETDEHYDEDYFCFWRYVKYLDILATTKDDVLELLYFYSCTFSKDLEITKDDYRKDLLEYIRVNIYDVEF